MPIRRENEVGICPPENPVRIDVTGLAYSYAVNSSRNQPHLVFRPGREVSPSVGGHRKVEFYHYVIPLPFGRSFSIFPAVWPYGE